MSELERLIHVEGADQSGVVWQHKTVQLPGAVPEPGADDDHSIRIGGAHDVECLGEQTVPNLRRQVAVRLVLQFKEDLLRGILEVRRNLTPDREEPRSVPRRIVIEVLEVMEVNDDGEVGSQRYPPLLNLFYPRQGNFVAFIGNTGSRRLVRRPEIAS